MYFFTVRQFSPVSRAMAEILSLPHAERGNDADPSNAPSAGSSRRDTLGLLSPRAMLSRLPSPYSQPTYDTPKINPIGCAREPVPAYVHDLVRGHPLTRAAPDERSSTRTTAHDQREHPESRSHQL